MSCSASRTAPVSAAAPPGLSITYETRLIRSSPKRICGFITPADARTSPVARSQRCPAMVVDPTSTAMPQARSVNPGSTAATVGAPPARIRRSADRRGPGGPGERTVQVGEHVRLDGSDDDPVLLAKSCAHLVHHARAVGGWQLHVRERHQRVDDEVGQVDVLADDRSVHLARGRDVDHGVAEERRGAGEPVVGGPRARETRGRARSNPPVRAPRFRPRWPTWRTSRWWDAPGSARRSPVRRRRSRRRRPAPGPRRGRSCPPRPAPPAPQGERRRGTWTPGRPRSRSPAHANPPLRAISTSRAFGYSVSK